MTGRTKREIRDQDVQGLQCLWKIRPLLSRLHALPDHPMPILIYAGGKPSRAKEQMVWYYLIGLASLKELEALITTRR